MKNKIVAAIDVGSHSIVLSLGEVDKKGNYKELEYFSKMTDLGHDAFREGKIKFETVDKLCDFLTVFKRVIDDYKVDAYKAVATSAIREAVNRDYIVDQVRLKTQIDLEVISNSQEQYLNHRAIKTKIKNFDQLAKEGVFILLIGAGSIQATAYDSKGLCFTENLKIGALRIREYFGMLERKVSEYPEILKEYIYANISGLEISKKKTKFKHMIIVGGEIRIIENIFKRHFDQEEYTKENMEKLCKIINGLSSQNLQEIYNIPYERAIVIHPSIIMARKFQTYTEAEDIIFPDIKLTDGIINELYEKLYKLDKKKYANADIIENARFLANKMYYNKPHQERIEEFALLLFDKTKKLHRLKEEKLLLQVSIILENIGKIIRLNKHSYNSYLMIKSMEIFGLSEKEVNMIAIIARFHNEKSPLIDDEIFKGLTEKDRIRVAKLIAISGLANALDKSQMQKFEIESVKNRKDKLIITVKTKAMNNTALEEWSFKNKADLFKEVFGVLPILKIKKEYI